VIVDVLSFSTCVAIAVERGAVVLPYPESAENSYAFAQARKALLAGRRNDPDSTYSLSPASMMSIPSGMRLVLPSPNGSNLSYAAQGKCTVVAGCLRNRAALVSWLTKCAEPVVLVAAGERWPDGSLRPCLEDLLGCGAIAAGLGGRLSPEAQAAAGAYDALERNIGETIRECTSGRELVESGFGDDVRLAVQLDVGTAVPVVTHGAYTSLELE
jgi:2-phosphosulfolactate phosphatase